MTRKDYIAIADALSNWVVPNGVLGDLCEVFRADNPRFTPEKFIRRAMRNSDDNLVEIVVAAYEKERQPW